MHVTHSPVCIVRQGIDWPDGHKRAFKGRNPVKDGGNHHEAQRRVVSDLVPCTAQGHQGIAGRCPGGHKQHYRKGHSKRLHPMGQGGVVQVVRAGPHVEKCDAPETQDRQTIGKDRAVGDRKSTRLNSSHVRSSYAVLCLKKNTASPVPRWPLRRPAAGGSWRATPPLRASSRPPACSDSRFAYLSARG